jgi:hypothetical protein
MRRTLAVLALLATSWPHVVVLECALGSPAPDAGAEARQGGMAALAGGHHGHQGRRSRQGAGHEQGPAPSAGSHADAAPGGLPCAMVMACGLLMIQAEREASAGVAPTAPRRMTRHVLETPSAVDLVADPPPPRRRA